LYAGGTVKHDVPLGDEHVMEAAVTRIQVDKIVLDPD